MQSTEERTVLINQLSQSIYNWKHANEFNELFIKEFIKEDTSLMDIDEDDKVLVIKYLEGIFKIVRKYDERNVSPDEESEQA